METNDYLMKSLGNVKMKQIFFVIRCNSKQRYKVKSNKLKEYDSFQIKREKLSGDISKFPPVQ